MATKTFTPLMGKRLRITALDVCGRVPTPGAEDSVLVTSGFVSIALSSEVEEGTEIVQKRADGSLCVNDKQPNSFKRFNGEVTLCGVDPAALSLLTNAEIYEDYQSNPSGFVVPEGTINKAFALELWTGLSGQACDPGTEEASGYFLLPFLQAGVLGDFSVDGENAINLSMTGAYTKSGNAWGTGPYAVMRGETGNTPAVLPTPLDPGDHLLGLLTGIAPPPESDGLVAFTPAVAP